MKRLYLFFALALLSSNAYSQINFMGGTTTDEKTESVIQYDSLSNIKAAKLASGEKDFFGHLIGQELIYVNTDVSNNIDFSLKKETQIGSSKYMRPASPPPNIGDEFTVLDVTPKKTSTFLEQHIIIKNNKTDSIYQISPGFDINSKWVVKGFYEKIKKLFVGSVFYYIEGADHRNDVDKLLKAETNEPFELVKNKSKWTCKDISIRITPKGDYSLAGDYRSRVILLFEDVQGNKCYSYLQNRYGDPLKNDFNSTNETVGVSLFLGKFLNEEQYLKFNTDLKSRKLALTKKYGASNAEAILKGRVRIGMTKEMCRESWGEAKDINKTSGRYGVHEQWVYGIGTYLYFENGILTTIQN